MKNLLFILPLFLIACSSGDGSGTDSMRQACDPLSPLVGAWVDGELNELTFGDQCIGLTNDDCQLRFTYYAPSGGAILIDISSSNDVPGCPQEGENVCAINHDTSYPETLTVNCGEGSIIYTPK